MPYGCIAASVKEKDPVWYSFGQEMYDIKIWFHLTLAKIWYKKIFHKSEKSIKIIKIN